eukprot:3594490-Rhodomonas_salina.1
MPLIRAHARKQQTRRTSRLVLSWAEWARERSVKRWTVTTHLKNITVERVWLRLRWWRAIAAHRCPAKSN